MEPADVESLRHLVTENDSLNQASTTAVHSSDADVHSTECIEKGWTWERPCDDVTHSTHRSQGPHQQCTEPSLTAEQASVWETVRHLPGVKLRACIGGNHHHQQQ